MAWNSKDAAADLVPERNGPASLNFYLTKARTALLMKLESNSFTPIVVPVGFLIHKSLVLFIVGIGNHGLRLARLCLFRIIFRIQNPSLWLL